MYKILLIEDNPDHQELITGVIQETYNNTAHIIISSTFYGGLSALTQQSFDIIIFDLNLPDSKVDNTIEEIKNLKLDIPVIALTSLNDTDFAKTLLSNGVQDYLSKDNLSAEIINKSFFYSIERKNFEKKMQHEIEEKEIFCYSLSHDFRSPIRRIETFSNILLEKNNLDEENKKQLHSISAQCTLLQNLIEELESYISLEVDSESISDTDLNIIMEQVKEANSDLFTEKSAKLSFSKLPVVKGLQSNLYLLFDNLILNAIKHNNKTPEINIFVENKPNTVRIGVSDNGAGIEDYFIKNVFMPFKKKHLNSDDIGSGLGLAIAKKIIHQHQGSISVESEVGKGSTFFIDFPDKIIVKSDVA